MGNKKRIKELEEDIISLRNQIHKIESNLVVYYDTPTGKQPVQENGKDGIWYIYPSIKINKAFGILLDYIGIRFTKNQEILPVKIIEAEEVER